MIDDQSNGESERLSRTEFDRCLLAVAFAGIAASVVAHVSSYFGGAFIQSRLTQEAFTWILLAIAVWVLFGGTRDTAKPIPRIWSAAMGLLWLNALFYNAISVTGSGAEPLWQGAARWLHFNKVPPELVRARLSSALQAALAVSIFVMLLFRPKADAGSAELVESVKPKSMRVRLLALFGIALPVGVFAVYAAFFRPNGEDPNVIQWIPIVAGFWFIAGTSATGVFMIIDAIRRDV